MESPRGVELSRPDAAPALEVGQSDVYISGVDGVKLGGHSSSLIVAAVSACAAPWILRSTRSRLAKSKVD